VIFPFDIYLYSFCSGLIVTALSLPYWRKFCARIGLIDDPGHRKIHHSAIPLAGGLGVLCGFVVPLILAAVWVLNNPTAAVLPGIQGTTEELMAHGFQRRGAQLAAIFAGAGGMLALGLLDDRFELPPKSKFFGQLFMALIVAASGVRITLFVHNALFSYAVTVLWILTITNAFNFMDNMNGLCGGVGLIVAWCCAWSAALKGQYLVALLGFQICGALLGFLPYNFPKASAFLGDSGSHLVGFLASILAILPSFYSREKPHVWAVLSPLLILFVPLLDLCWVVLLRWKRGVPFYIGDTNHLSHRLVRRGFSQSTAVLLLWLFSASTGAIALLVLLR
jgi:UDP-GlcNAc:undecaprenyl-phosphate GlcNAc-1-phosphate transferase